MVATPTSADATAPGNPQTTVAVHTEDTAAQQAARASVNVGNTVRASWRFSLDNVRANIRHMSPEARDLLVWAFLWCTDNAHPTHFENFCNRIQYAENTIYKIYSGKYKHPEDGSLMDAPAKLVKNLRDFRRLEISRSKLGAKQFYHTATAKRVYWAIDQARKSGRPVMIYGSSQIGKTEAFRQNTLDFNHGKTILVEIEAVNGLRGLLQAIAVKLGISPKANTPDLIERIKNAITSDMVLILDEVHLLANVYRKGSFFACMEQIRRLWDAKKFGLVLSYTELGYDRAEKERKRELMQIFRRGVLKVNLGSMPSVEDVQIVTEGLGLAWDERHERFEVAPNVSDTPWEALKQLAREEGLTSIIERGRMAHELAADDGRDAITWHDYLRAHFAIQKLPQAPATGWEKEAA